ncbi:DUF3332 domain-containing protein [Parasalinivibrio latis]|uniref:DUF3332 domain-containing protein n=1 Tax=Parasalinivibrio latis TaxID=2952610 RepID=UPI0030E1E403
MKKFTLKCIAAAVMVTSLSGCMGSMGLSSMVTKANLSAVDNRYGRAGLYVLMSPVYGIAATADLFIFNSIEFWTGKNPITGKSPALVDMPVNAVFKVNDKLDKDLTKAPLANVMHQDIKSAEMQQIDANTLEMKVAYNDGSNKVLRGEKAGEMVNFYLDGQFVSAVSIDELNQYASMKA